MHALRVVYPIFDCLTLCLCSKALVDELMGDPDSEVRLRVCRMLLALWNLHLHTSEQAKRSRSEGEKLGGYQPLFYILEGDKRLLEAV